VPSATRTVVFTDLANYTASVSRANREALRDLLRNHEALVIPTLRRHNGRIVKNLGDSFMALFDSATDAVRGGLDLVVRAREAELSIRVSAATGDVEEIEGDAFGDAVNLSARINSKTPADEVWLSESTFHCMNQAETPWDRVGVFSLKGIAGEVPVYRAVPRNRAWLPEAVGAAARDHTLVVLRQGEPIRPLPPEPVVLLQGFTPGGDLLQRTIDNLPVLDPACIHLVAYHIAPGDRFQWQEVEGHGLVIGTTKAVDEAVLEEQRLITQDVGSNTIILDTGYNAALQVSFAGLAFPNVPMSDVVGGYSYDLLEDGRWVNVSDQAVLRVDVAPGRVSMVATSPKVRLNDRQLPLRSRLELKNGMAIRTGDRMHVFHKLENDSYAGFLLSQAPVHIMVSEGQPAELGREPGHPGLALPDRRGQANIRWCAGPRAARARESGFTLDRALAGRRQVSITMREDRCVIEPLHERCPTYLWRKSGELTRIFSTAMADIGDYVVVGTTVISLQAPLK